MINTGSLAVTTFWIMLSVPFVHGQDLSGYREFQFGTNLSTIAEQAGLEPSEATVIHQRPALIQELIWQSPFSLSSSPPADPVLNLRFSFYNGELFRIVVNYYRTNTNGLTAEDMVEALSATYGAATTPAAEITFSLSGAYGNNQVVIARWEDPQYSFNLFRSSYGFTFGMLAYSKRLNAVAQAAGVEAIRLDKQEAPQREITQQRMQDEANHATQKHARTGSQT
jgi:hypothetical protein